MKGTAEGTDEGGTGWIIGAAIRVLPALKPGLDEELYENALVIELAKLGMEPEQQRAFPVHYDGKLIGKLVPDLIVGDVVVDAKVVTTFSPDHVAQVPGYLNITGLPLGLLLNFRYRKLQIKRVILRDEGSLDGRLAAL
ncbi:MAG: GxxExxY protein [Chthoniobacterales bacterium]